MPNTVLEAMSIGVPVAVTKKTNILDIPQVLNCTDEKLINPSLWSI